MAIVETAKVYEKVPVSEVIYENEKADIPTYGYGIRHVQTFLVFICMIIGYIARAHLGVSIVAMTNSIAPITNVTINVILNGTYYNATNALDLNVTIAAYDINGTVFDIIKHNAIVNNTDYNGTDVSDLNGTSDISDNKSDSIWNVYQTYNWAKPTQEMILGAFFLGYCITMFPTGMLCQRFGGKLPLQICLLTNGIVSLITPSVAVWGGWKAVCFCRILQGSSQAGLYPSAHTLLAKWVPISERATLSSFVYTGTLIGTVLAFQIAGMMADSAAGWPGIFWCAGALCIATFIMLTVFGAASPAVHKTISVDEKNYILGKIDDNQKKKAAKTPWKHIFTSKPIWSTFATHTASGIVFVFLFTQIPTYMHYILGYDVKNSGLLSSLPYVASAFANMGFGIISDFCINRGLLTTKNARILCNSLAQVGPAICLATVTFTHNSELAVFLLIMALALYAGIHSGWMVNYIDLSPNFSGSLMATGNTCSTFGMLFLPVLTSNVLTDVYNRYQWRIVMFIMASMMFISNTLFALFMSAEPQPWDQVEDMNEHTETEMKSLNTKGTEEKM